MSIEMTKEGGGEIEVVLEQMQALVTVGGSKKLQNLFSSSISTLTTFLQQL